MNVDYNIMETCLLISFSLELLIFLSLVYVSNPVHSIILLIISFCSLGSIMLYFGSEFLFFVILILYAGGVMILFVFSVMFLSVPYYDLEGYKKIVNWRHRILSLLICRDIIFWYWWYPIYNNKYMDKINEFIIEYVIQKSPEEAFSQLREEGIKLLGDCLNNVDTLTSLSQYLYNLYGNYWIIYCLGFVLLVSMMGSISLVLRVRYSKKK